MEYNKSSNLGKILIILGLFLALTGAYILKRPERVTFYENKLKSAISAFKSKVFKEKN